MWDIPTIFLPQDGITRYGTLCPNSVTYLVNLINILRPLIIMIDVRGKLMFKVRYLLCKVYKQMYLDTVFQNCAIRISNRNSQYFCH